MLASLTIKDIVLIESLNLEFGSGLSILTGETGAGKSILLDALSFALGSRGDAGLVRKGQPQGQVTAVFSLPPIHAAFAILNEAEITVEPGEEIIIRRTQYADGRTKALVNDQAISAQTLKALGAGLVEINGQHDARGLMDEKFHIHLLDSYGGYTPLLNDVREAYTAMKAAQKALRTHEEMLEQAQKDRDYMQAVYEELSILNPQMGEEETLAEARTQMMNAEKVLGDVNEAYEEIAGNASPIPNISSVMRKLERKTGAIAPQIEPIAQALGQALDQLNIAAEELQSLLRALNFNPKHLEETEERLFALRAAARKHKVPADMLPTILAEAEKSLTAISDGERELKALAEALSAAEAHFGIVAAQLTEARHKASQRLVGAVMNELPALKLEKAKFDVAITPATPSALGQDEVGFMVQTNPGAGFASIAKIASGGELSRFLLGLKVALADVGSAPTLIFDEIDTGVGGAVAAAMGARLKSLSSRLQVLAITHAPQVAAHANAHFHIRKAAQGEGENERVITHVRQLNDHERREELARMLSGAEITAEARAAADRLLGVADAA